MICLCVILYLLGMPITIALCSAAECHFKTTVPKWANAMLMILWPLIGLWLAFGKTLKD